MRVVCGVNPVMEALRSGGAKIEKVLIADSRGKSAEILRAAREAGAEVRVVPEEEIVKLAGGLKHQGVLALLRGEFRYSDIEDLITGWKGRGGYALFLVLDSIQDPQNLGSLIRTANGAGADGVIIPKDRATEVTPLVAKASAGATEHTPVAREVNIARAIERLKQEGVWVAGIEAGKGESIYSADLDRDLAIVVGSEGKGIRRLVSDSCDFLLSIPMFGQINSLNAAQAGAIAMFEARRQRLGKK